MKINELLDKPIHRRAELGKIVRAVIASGNTEAWDQLDAEEKFYGLDDNGLVPDTASSWEWKDANRSDKVLFNAIRQRQDNKYQIDIGPEKRDELKSKAEELAEIKRQQLRKESLEDAEIAFQRAETKAEREAEMEKIKRKFQHDLEVINTEHKNNMEAIRTGNAHDIEKMNKEHSHEKEMFDKEAGEREKDREANRPQSQQPQPNFEPEVNQEEPSSPDFDQFKADLFKLSGLPAPEKKDDETPSKYNNDDAIDVDFKEIPSDDEKKDDQGKPNMLPAPKKENIADFRNIVDKFSKEEPTRKNIPNSQKKFEIGQTVEFGPMYSVDPLQVGKIVGIDDHILTIDVNGKPVKVHVGAKSLSINIVDEK